MIVRKSDLWDSSADLIAVTTCGSIVGSTRHLVMGAGAAFQASRRYPRLPAAAGRCVEDELITAINGVPLYGFLVIKLGRDTQVGIFQSKLVYYEPSLLSVIGTSVACLLAWLGVHPKTKVAINFPGIGLGKLEREKVEPLLAELPDCVTFHVL